MADMENSEKIDLAVIGAGWNGLMIAKTYLELHPFSSIVLFEDNDSVGGVWATNRLYPGLKSNNMVGTYEYPDFPMDHETFGIKPGQFIPGEVLHDYLTRFAKKFGVYERIRFLTKVWSAEKKGKEGWLLGIKSSKGQSTILTEKLVVATGMTSEPFMPEIKGSESFEAPIFHVKSLREKASTIKAANEVVILGGTKSAWDAAYAYAQAEGDAQVHMVIRESGHGPIWMAPPYVTPLKKWLEKLVHTRLLTWFSPCIWGAADGYTGIRDFFHGTAFGRGIVNTFWKILGNDVLTLNAYDKHLETKKLKPWSNPMFIGSGLSILNYDHDFFDLVRSGKIKVHIANITSLSKRAVYLSTGERLNADALVCSTGWKHRPSIQFLPAGSDASYGLPHYSEKSDSLTERADEEILSKFPRLKTQPVQNAKMTAPTAAASDTYAPSRLNRPFRLYRFMVPPSVAPDRSLAFAGVPMTITTSIIASVQALWISAYFDGKISLDGISSAELEYETELHSCFGKWRYPAGHGAQYPDFVFDALPYLDMLLQQIGLASHRKGGRLAEMLQPYGPEDYRGLIDEWKKATGI